MMTCRALLQCLFKMLNFFLLVTGILMVVYSGWMYKEWIRSQQAHPPSSPPDLQAVKGLLLPSVGSLSTLRSAETGEPVPWFIDATFGAGVFITLVTLIGCCAAESLHHCCLSCYHFGLILMLVVQAAIAALIFFDRSWEKDLPDDATGQARKTKEFVLQNFEICKWGGLGVLGVEVLALLLAMTLRAMNKQPMDEEDEIATPRPRWRRVHPDSREPLIPSRYPPPPPGGYQQGPPPPPRFQSPGPDLALAGPPGDPKADAWRTRMRQKYGLDPAELALHPERRARALPPPPAEEKHGCALL